MRDAAEMIGAALAGVAFLWIVLFGLAFGLVLPVLAAWRAACWFTGGCA